MDDKTPEEIVDSIPADMRGHVFHLLGKALGHNAGGAQTNDTGDDSGGHGGGGQPPPP